MKMTLEELRQTIFAMTDDIEFLWHGKKGLIIPFGPKKFVLGYSEDDTGREFHDVQALLNEPYFDGRTLVDIVEEADFL